MALLVLIALWTATPLLDGQRTDLAGAWERVDQGPPGIEWSRRTAPVPCSADEAQLQILASLGAPPRLVTTQQTEAAVVFTPAAGAPTSHHVDGREERLSAGGVDAVHSARWVDGRVLTIEWRLAFGATIVERYSLIDGASRLQLDQTIEHRALSRPAQRRVSYRRVTQPPPAAPALQAPAGQVADTTFRPHLASPAFPEGRGPAVLIDEAHANFHTATGRYLPFADLLRRDGYVVAASAQRLTSEALREASLLVIANAREPLDGSEVKAVQDWVGGGGSLLLIVDHPPNVAASISLAGAFGIRLIDKGIGGRLTFRKSDGTLKDHPITQGIDHVMTFTGSAFDVDGGGEPLLVFGPGACTSDLDPNPVPLQGRQQGGVMRVGAGRIGVFAEAAMFSAQVTGPNRATMGMNDPDASENAQFLLNLVHWLSAR